MFVGPRCSVLFMGDSVFVWLVASLVVTMLFCCVSLVPHTVFSLGHFYTGNKSNVHCVWLVLYAVMQLFPLRHLDVLLSGPY